LDETWGIATMKRVFHLDNAINAQSEQKEIHTLLDWFKDFSAGIESGELPIWWWDPVI
jgi:hypothetical protein